MPKVALNGIEINYVDHGKGDVILLIHNVVSNISGYDAIISELERDFRVIALDLRGHGDTTHLDDDEQASTFYTFDNIANDILHLLTHLEVERFLIVGQAYWGVSTAAHIFNRVPSRVDAMVFATCDFISTDVGVPPYTVLGDKAIANFERMVTLAREQGMMGVYEERLRSKTFWSKKVLESPNILKQFEDMHRRTSPVAFSNFPHFSHETKANVTKKLKEYSTDVMMLLGADDTHNEQMMSNMRRDYEPTHITLLPYCGHYPAIENPSDFSSALFNFAAGVAKRKR